MKILIACFAKSGSSYLSTLISNLPAFSIANYVPDYGRREQELSELCIERSNDISNQVAQHHVRASEHTIHIIKQYNLLPIVLVRNIQDSLVSLADHMANESTVFPFGYFDGTHAQLAMEDRIDALIDLVAPWYINFYVSWWHARPEAIVSYEDLILNGPKRQTEYFQSIGIKTDYDTVMTAYGLTMNQSIRLNVGKPGRGQSLVSSSGRQRIKRLASYYPEVDFSIIGIDKE